jgi:beta-N-acetylhexosaminidase
MVAKEISIVYLQLSDIEKRRVDTLVGGFNTRQKIGQTFCIQTGNMSPGQVADVVDKYAIGGLFYAYRSTEDTAAITAAAQAVGNVPVIAAADLVNGPGARLENTTLFPWQMAVGAANSEDLAEKMGIATAREGRAAGLHWTFGPIVDLSLNMLNCMMHTRTFGDDP